MSFSLFLSGLAQIFKSIGVHRFPGLIVKFIVEGQPSSSYSGKPVLAKRITSIKAEKHCGTPDNIAGKTLTTCKNDE